MAKQKKPETKKPVVRAFGKDTTGKRIPRVVHRVTTHKGAASTSTEVAPEMTSGDGPIVLPSPEDSVKVLAELAALNDKALAAHRVYLELKDRAKTAKEKWDGLSEQVQATLRRVTHASELPLFDAIEREQDQATMEAAAVVEDVPASDPGLPADPANLERVTDRSADDQSEDAAGF